MAVTRRLTKPISELTELSRKMTDLDFEARYKSKAGNEIDVLGIILTKCPVSWRTPFPN